MRLLPIYALLLSLLACQANLPVPYRAPPPTPFSPSQATKLPGADSLFRSFYALVQESASYRLTSLTASIAGQNFADSSTLVCIYTGNQLIDKRVRLRNAAVLTDLPRRLTFDAQNRLVTDEVRATEPLPTGNNGNVRSVYTYTADGQLASAARYTSVDGREQLAVSITYQYANGRRSGADIESSISLSSAVPAPRYTIKRRYNYAPDNQSVVFSDNDGAILIDAILDAKGAILSQRTRHGVAPESGLYVFLEDQLEATAAQFGAESDRFVYAYDGPDGLISEAWNQTRAIRYRFTYQRK